MFQILFKNLLGYDTLIIALALFNGFYLFPRVKKQTNKVKRSLKKTIYVPINELYKKMGDHNIDINLHDIQDMRDQEVKLYHMFDMVNGLFPMLGILGTIIGLLQMVTLDTSVVTQNFTVALTSTFWGLVFGIVFRALDGTILADYLSNKDQVEILFERIDQYIEEQL